MPTSSPSSSSSNLRRPAAAALVVSSGELEASEASSSSASGRRCQFDAEKERPARDMFLMTVDSQLPNGPVTCSAVGAKRKAAIQLVAWLHCAQREDESYVPHFPAMMMMVSDI
jgi:hypothetical protein